MDDSPFRLGVERLHIRPLNEVEEGEDEKQVVGGRELGPRLFHEPLHQVGECRQPDGQLLDASDCSSRKPSVCAEARLKREGGTLTGLMLRWGRGCCGSCRWTSTKAAERASEFRCSE